MFYKTQRASNKYDTCNCIMKWVTCFCLSWLRFVLASIPTSTVFIYEQIRVSVQGVKSLGGHFASLCRGFDFYEVKKEEKILLFFKNKTEILLHF